MKELYYFSKSDVMIQVQYSNHSGSLRYSSHRKLTEEERDTIERYLMKNVMKDYANMNPKNPDYIGIDYRLINSLNQFHSVKPSRDPEQSTIPSMNPFKSLISKDIDKSVEHLIHTSMSNYYFEKIGSTILEARKEIEANASEATVQKYRAMLQELVDAYNEYTERKVDVKMVLPRELCDSIDAYDK